MPLLHKEECHYHQNQSLVAMNASNGLSTDTDTDTFRHTKLPKKYITVFYLHKKHNSVFGIMLSHLLSQSVILTLQLENYNTQVAF